jgi:hypothetical protein
VATERKKALIVVRTYPTPAKKHIEVSCTAAITDQNEWLRLFPVPYRFLDHDQRFRKYQWVNVTVEKASDARIESYKLAPDGIEIITEPLSTANNWIERKKVVFPLRAHCLCCLKAQRDQHGTPTLGLFKPRRIKRLILQASEAQWTQEQLEILRQQTMFSRAPTEELEKVPYDFKYEFECDHDECPGHTLTCTDWEMGESWRKWRNEYGAAWESKFRQKYEEDMLYKHDTHFYVGTVHRYPKAWIIVGLFYPPLDPNLPLF